MTTTNNSSSAEGKPPAPASAAETLEDEDRQCACEHFENQHFALGCSRCNCTYFVTWDEIDADRIAGA